MNGEHDKIEAGSALDAMVEHHIFSMSAPQYSIDIAAAWQALEGAIAKENAHNRDDGNVEAMVYLFSTDAEQRWACRIWHPGISKDAVIARTSTAPTAPLAICRAAMKVSDK